MHLVVLLPVQYYLVRARVVRPITRLERELRGDLPWEPDGDELLRPLRRALEDLRGMALDTVSDAQHRQEKLEELQVRLDDDRSGQVLCDRIFEAVRAPGPVAQYAATVAGLLRAAWPADHVLLLARRAPGNEFHVVYAEHGGDAVSEPAALAPGYSRASMPRPVKDALRRGFAVETGVPFARDPGLPDARSFVAIGLEHGGSVSGVLLLATSSAAPPSAEPLRRARPLLSLAFSRSLLLEEREEIAVRDSLTGAYTSDHFFAQLRQEVARSNRYSRPLACLVVDVDRLCEINDRYGARFGDRVIAQVAQLVQGAIRSTDVLGRVSGGEMALLLPETDGDSARVVAERIRERVEGHAFVLRPSLVERYQRERGHRPPSPRGGHRAASGRRRSGRGPSGQGFRPEPGHGGGGRGDRRLTVPRLVLLLSFCCLDV